ncbi:MAG: tRNA pseudouridine(55) synthase TruB [Clostridia bacterium]|nr:tRNA pseudouridine(55) synthase TruB [Clostridia bacterium]
MDGIINLYKPRGYTSHDATSRIKRFCGTRRVGHAGTLDPMAQGVLPVLVGRATAAQDYIMSRTKSYRAGMRFGITTDTGDITGKVLSVNETALDPETVMQAAEKFVGKISQVPPMYSAIKIDGKKLYELAREGVTVERRAREVEIFSIELVKAENATDFLIDISCSKGTYIRTLCEDIGKTLGCGGALYSLERTSSGVFCAGNCVTMEELEKAYEDGGHDAVEKFLIPAEDIFRDLKKVTLSPFYTKLCKNGCEIYLEKAHLLPEEFPEGTLVRIYGSDGNFMALGKSGMFREGAAIKAVVRFCD